MDELAKDMASLRGAVVPAWTEARAERLLSGVAQLRRRRRAQRIVSAGVMSLAAVGLLAFRGLNADAGSNALASRGLSEPASQLQNQLQYQDKPAAIAASQPEQQLAQLPLKLADGSHVRSLAQGAAVSVENNQADRIQLRLDAGGARFDVIPNKQRVFTVRAGSVEVAVLGTVFDVERDHGRVRVSVSRGKVRVRTAPENGNLNETAIVKAGESVWFEEHPEAAAGGNAPQEAADAAVSGKAEETSALEPRAVKSRTSKHAARASVARDEPREPQRAAWRSLSQSGDYDGAYRLLQQSTVEDDSGALLDAADAARLSGHPQAAVMYLRKVLDQHHDTPVAPLAAFTLGRVLLERLGQPSEAADAFGTARKLAPGGSLAQDALAREVEAWSKAGHPDQAYRRAREYVERYPEGRRLRAVQLYGGLQAQ